MSCFSAFFPEIAHSHHERACQVLVKDLPIFKKAMIFAQISIHSEKWDSGFRFGLTGPYHVPIQLGVAVVEKF